MSKYVVDYQSLKSIANAIRNRHGTTDTMLLSEMPSVIEGIPQSVNYPMGASLSDINVTADTRTNYTTLTAPSTLGGITNVSA